VASGAARAEEPGEGTSVGTAPAGRLAPPETKLEQESRRGCVCFASFAFAPFLCFRRTAGKNRSMRFGGNHGGLAGAGTLAGEHGTTYLSQPARELSGMFDSLFLEQAEGSCSGRRREKRWLGGAAFKGVKSRHGLENERNAAHDRGGL
jgi:hypothetical protein